MHLGYERHMDSRDGKIKEQKKGKLVLIAAVRRVFSPPSHTYARMNTVASAKLRECKLNEQLFKIFISVHIEFSKSIKSMD